jgi:hypothetical protein
MPIYSGFAGEKISVIFEETLSRTEKDEGILIAGNGTDL